jgi:hypothetical protein
MPGEHRVTIEQPVNITSGSSKDLSPGDTRGVGLDIPLNQEKIATDSGREPCAKKAFQVHLPPPGAHALLNNLLNDFSAECDGISA